MRPRAVKIEGTATSNIHISTLHADHIQMLNTALHISPIEEVSSVNINTVILMFRGTQKTSRRYATNDNTLFSLSCSYGFPQI